MSRVLSIVSVFVILAAVGVWYFVPSVRQIEWSSIQIPFLSKASCLAKDETLFSSSQLASFSGQEGGPIYLAFLGIVYDVTRGAKHYGPGGTYAAFAAKDATRAFITGNFQEDLLDDVSDLETAAFSGIREWTAFYEREYVRKGRLIGSYYDSNGCPTQKLQLIHEKFSQLDKEESEKKKEEEDYPSCNSEWSQESRTTRFWCTDLSGGVKRSWAGVPRNLYVPRTKTSRCACVRTPQERENDLPGIVYDEPDPMLKEYAGCEPSSRECFVSDDDK